MLFMPLTVLCLMAGSLAAQPPVPADLPQTCPTGAGPFEIYGFHLLSWRADGYGSSASAVSLKEIAATGAKWIVLVPFQYMQHAGSNKISAGPKTASDAALIAAAAQAKSLGLMVALKPHVDCLDGTFRGLINPTDDKAWFGSYSSMIIHYAALARVMTADAYVVGTELHTMTRPQYHKYWNALIAKVRDNYDGTLTYAAHWLEWDSVPFWDKLDIIGVDAYFPMGLPGSPSSKEKLAQVWKENYISKLRAYSQFHSKPLFFAEIGIASMKNSHAWPWVYKPIMPVDLEVQANYFAALFDAFRDQGGWFKGFWQWGWTVDSNDGGPSDRTHTVEGKPALEVLIKEFKK
ncbi:MAG: hypothetical protein HY747_03030 [Elusimicrobia bacterium]|nr:hypothetical protein [Elusimicrobiota bacterium]